jgi:TonB family protein
MRNVVHRLALFLLLGVCCRADLTLRYTVEMKTGSGAPPALAKTMAIRIKGDKSLTQLGALTAIIANSDSSITLLNPATKQYAQALMAEYIDMLRAKLPSASAALMKQLKFDVETSKTGQFEMISGIRAEEHLTKMTMSMDAPGVPAGPLVRLEMHMWLASPDELNGFPALRQYAASAQRAMNISAAGDAVEKLFQQVPGAAEKLRVLTEEAARNSGSLTLKIQEAVYNPKGAPNAPIAAITIELAEISSDAIDDSIFAPPPDFQLVSVAELIKVSTPVPPVPQGLRQIPPGQQIGRGAPMVIYKVDPEYTEEARRAKLEGGVLLKIVVGADGVAKNIQVVRSLGLGLDEKAIEAVSRWKFRPGEKNGQPVDVTATIMVNFRLVVRPPQQ